MAERWEARLRAAQRARFDATWLGRVLASVGMSTAWVERLRFSKAGVAAFAWMVVPPKLKLIAGAVVAAWLLTAAAILAFTAFVFSQIL